MNNLLQVVLGNEKVYVGNGATLKLGEEVRSLGTKILVVAGDKSLAAAQRAGLDATLRDAGITWQRYPFTGYCSEKNVAAAMAAAEAAKAQVLVGIGGGKCMDITKSVADKLSIPCILLPTSCATCAAYVRLCVWYDDQGRCVPGMFAKHMTHALLIDTQLILADSDPRLLAAGMMDALAKFPEIDYSMVCMPESQRRAPLVTACAVARSNFDYILDHGLAALEDMKSGKLSQAAENMVMINIVTTGLASNLVAGVQQLAVAHMFHDAVASCFYAQRSKCLHGEMVAVGVLLQMHSNGYDSAFIEKTNAFIKSVNGPVCLSDMDIQPSEETRATILDYITKRGYDAPEIRKKIEAAYETINY